MRSSLALVLLAAACGSSKPAVTQTTADDTTAQGSATQTDTTLPPSGETPPASDVPSKPVNNTTLAAVGLDATALDRSVDPCDDFYQFTCGGWVAKTEIPADLPLAMRSFVDIELRNEAYLHDVLEKARTQPGKDAITKQVGSYYGSCMDEVALNKAGLKPIAPLLAQIDKMKEARAVAGRVTALELVNANPLFAFGPTEDVADVTKMIGSVDQGGLGLPDRDYYLENDERSKALRAQYAETVAAMLVEAGHKPDVAKKEADEVLALETEIAKVHKDKVAMRDPKGTYNKIDRAGLTKAMPHFAWDGFFKAVGQPGIKDLTTSSPEFLAGLDALIVKTPIATWKNHFTASLLLNSAAILPQKFEDIAFKLSQKLSGATEQRDRWKRCVGHTENALPQSLGQIFVRDRFPGDSKTAAEQQVKAISDAMNANIDALPWMDAQTKAKAHEKAQVMAYMIGYPAKWREYTFKIAPTTWTANALAARKFNNAWRYGKIGKPVDRTEWDISPAMVNAFYHPTHNKMVFPAGILQTPFYQVDHSVAVNLGGMGMVVGHELTHGFDDQGAQFDAKGNLANWWQPETEKQFKQRTTCVAEQYGKYEIAGKKLNGNLTLGENIADIGGIKLALAAYRALRASAPQTDVADGFTEDQQFFISFGQTWCAKARPEYEAMLATVDPHSPPKWRVNGAVSDSPEFAKAFRCKIGAAMRPRNACVVW